MASFVYLGVRCKHKKDTDNIKKTVGQDNQFDLTGGLKKETSMDNFTDTQSRPFCIFYFPTAHFLIF